MIVNFENDGAPGSSQTTITDYAPPGASETFNIQPVPNYAFYDTFPLFWGRLDGAPQSMEFCTESSATASCFGNSSDVQSVRARVLNTLDTRATFTDTRQFFIQFLQTTPDGSYIAENPSRSLLDMAVSPDIGSNPVIGPAVFGCDDLDPGCFAELRPENVNIVAINFYDRTDFTVDHLMTQAEIDGCVNNNGPCDLTAQQLATVSCSIFCIYTDPVHFDFVDQVIRFDEYARTAPVVTVTPAIAPAATGWYNAATLGRPGGTLAVNVTANTYYYSRLAITALGCTDNNATVALSAAVPAEVAHGSATLGDGLHQLNCQATDAASLGFNHQGNIGAGPGSQATPLFKIDTQPPQVSYSGNGGSYGILATLAIACSATDATSGVATSSCPGASGPGWSFGAGQHTLNATATDNAGNSAAASTTFTITVAPGDLATLTRQFVDGSAAYKGLPAFGRAIVDFAVGADTTLLSVIGPKTTAAQKRTLISLYVQAVRSLAKNGWLTASQGTTLTALSAAL